MLNGLQTTSKDSPIKQNRDSLQKTFGDIKAKRLSIGKCNIISILLPSFVSLFGWVEELQLWATAGAQELDSLGPKLFPTLFDMSHSLHWLQEGDPGETVKVLTATNSFQLLAKQRES